MYLALTPTRYLPRSEIILFASFEKQDEPMLPATEILSADIQHYGKD